MKKLRTTVEEIGPEKAAEYLLANRHNRPLRFQWIKALSRQMSQGLWHTSGESIIFGRSGKLLDGQHRLKAIIHSGTSQWFVVVRGAEDATFSTIDTGQKRSPKDALHIAGFAQPILYARLGLQCLRWNRGIFFGGSHAAIAPTNDEIVAYCEDHRKVLAESINHFMQLKSRLRGILQAQVMLFTYHKFKEKDENDAFIFYEKLLTGMTKEKREQPISALRKRLIENMNSEAKLPLRILTLMVFGAWNAYRNKETLTDFRLSTDQVKKKDGRVLLV